MASLIPPVDVSGDGKLAALNLPLGYASALSLSLGLIFVGLFFVVENSKNRPNIIISIILAIISSLLLGFGFVFTFMWAVIFV